MACSSPFVTVTGAGANTVPGSSRCRRTTAAAPRQLASSRTRAVSSESASAAPAGPAPPAPSRLEGEAAERLKAVHANDLTHLFDDVGLDKSLYEADVAFEDPLSKFDNIDAFLFNISMLKNVFR